jgi:hypothetical protein
LAGALPEPASAFGFAALALLVPALGFEADGRAARGVLPDAVAAAPWAAALPAGFEVPALGFAREALFAARGFDADAGGFTGADAEVFAAAVPALAGGAEVFAVSGVLPAPSGVADLAAAPEAVFGFRGAAVVVPVRGVGAVAERGAAVVAPALAVGAVADRGAPAEPAAGAPVVAGAPDTPPRRSGAGFVPLAAALVRAVPVARGAPAPVFAPPARVARGVVAAGVAGVTGAVVSVSSSWRRRRPARFAPVCAATLPRPTTESMMSFGLMAMRTVCPRGARTTRR